MSLIRILTDCYRSKLLNRRLWLKYFFLIPDPDWLAATTSFEPNESTWTDFQKPEFWKIEPFFREIWPQKNFIITNINFFKIPVWHVMKKAAWFRWHFKTIRDNLTESVIKISHALTYWLDILTLLETLLLVT